MSLDENILLSKSLNYTIANYKRDLLTQNKENIAKFIYSRFKEHYIDAVRGKGKNGFSIMAISCLMIEAIETFKKGEPNSDKKSKQFFIDFFDECSQLQEFKCYSEDFYYSIRCGILHQAETTNGWKINRKGNLFDPNTLTINATKFLKKLQSFLEEYSENLKKADWNDSIWINFREKMKAIINNCKIKTQSHLNV